MDEATLRDLTARRDIHDLLCRYARALDRLRPDDLRPVFHADAIIDGGQMTGPPEAFIAFACGLLGAGRASHHQLGQALVSVHGDTANGEVYFTAHHRIARDDGEADQFIAGRYVDRYERREGAWRIARRKVLVDWERTEAATPSALTVLPRSAWGARGDADFSATRDWSSLGG